MAIVGLKIYIFELKDPDIVCGDYYIYKYFKYL
jgi:hypothetical protein